MANIFEKNKTYLGDCLELMPQMESGIFDMILCDLPYGTTACKWDTIIPFEQLWKEYERLIKPNGAIVLTASQPFTSKLIMSNIDLFKYELIWKKSNPTGMGQANKRPMKYHENICVFFKKQPTYNKQMIVRTDKTVKSMIKNGGVFNVSNTMSGNQQSVAYKNIEANRYSETEKNPSSIVEINSIRPISNEHNEHPTQKPVKLFEWLIKTYTNEGELILDNCAGSGTTGEGCFNTNRNYIQIEKEQKYFDLILGREKSFNKKDYQQESLFGGQM